MSDNSSFDPVQPQGQLDQAFLNSIQDEYATRYLEHMRIEPTRRNIARLLEKRPLTSCCFKSGWNNSGWLADSIQIYPNRGKTEKTYENDREKIVETKLRHERLLRKAENQKEDIWRKLEDEESDEEIAQKMRELFGPSGAKRKAKGIVKMSSQATSSSLVA